MKREGFKLLKRDAYYIEYRKHVNEFKTKIMSVSITNKNTILEQTQKTIFRCLGQWTIERFEKGIVKKMGLARAGT